MKTKFILIVFTLVLLNVKLFAQEPDKQPKNVVKLNLAALGFQNVSLQYERAFHKNFSFAFQGGLLLSRTLPKQFQPKENSDFSDLKFTGFNCASEIRIYLGKKAKHPAPRGFYIAPYARFSSYKASAFFMYTDSNAVPIQDVPVDFKATFKGFGGGLLIGTQFIIAKKVSIDWWILGGHFGVASLHGEMDSQIVQDNQYSFYEQLEEVSVPYGTKTFEVKGSKASINLDGIPFGGIRSGFCLGVVF